MVAKGPAGVRPLAVVIRYQPVAVLALLYVAEEPLDSGLGCAGLGEAVEAETPLRLRLRARLVAREVVELEKAKALGACPAVAVGVGLLLPHAQLPGFGLVEFDPADQLVEIPVGHG